MRYHVEDVTVVLNHLGSDVGGLSEEQVKAKREKHGWNELDKAEGSSLFELILEQFDDILVKILLVAAFVSFILAYLEGDGTAGAEAYVEPIVILIILILNAMVGVWQESNAESALEALKDLQPQNARCVRDGALVTIAARELVPGDVVELVVGDKVPADLRLISMKTTNMLLEQAQLTGESQSVSKDIDALPKSTEDIIQAKTNLLFSSTVVVMGGGRGVVVSSGMDTEIGQIQKSVQEAASEEEATPLKKKLDEFGELLSQIIGIICILVWVINYKNFNDPVHGSWYNGCIYYFKIAVALAVAAIPEGLPAVITTCLALGTRKMAKKNAIVRKLPSVETLGCTSVICSDKTGTLTTNEMSCISFCHASTSETDINLYDVDGTTYAPVGKVHGLSNVSNETKCVNMLCKISSLCNESTLEYNDGKYVRVGQPTEAALKVLVEKIGIPDATKQAKNEAGRKNEPGKFVQCANEYWESLFSVVSMLEFTRDRKSMSVICSPKSGKGDNVLFVKGAPEGILARCSKVMLQNGQIVPLTAKGREVFNKQVDLKAGDALRCLGFALKELKGDLATFDGDRRHPARKLLSNQKDFSAIESDMTFVALTGTIDPPRPEVKPMVMICRQAGIRVVMITGDNKNTANAVATSVGLFREGEDLSEKSFTGSEFFSLSAEKQMSFLSTDSSLAFSRTEPKHKQQLVRMFKQTGAVVAMTGDGVNDAPALKQADIGIAMGISGTEVAKEASDMVLADDNFSTIVFAVEEGRAIYNNMQAFIRYLISSNIGEVAAIFLTAALGMPEGLIPVQLLWVNLVTDGPPATALGFNPPDADIMKKLPRRADDVLINGWVFFRYMVVGMYVGFACVGVFAYWYMYYDGSNDGHTLITYDQLTHWGQCPNWENFEVANFKGMDFSDDPCGYFRQGKIVASTLSLSVLVTIEMLNALNALSEDGSLIQMPPWVNPYLILAMIVSFGMHFLILEVDWLSDVFFVVPLDYGEWMLVLAFSFPVIIIDEVLKYVGRQMAAKDLKARLHEHNPGKKFD